MFQKQSKNLTDPKIWMYILFVFLQYYHVCSNSNYIVIFNSHHTFCSKFDYCSKNFWKIHVSVRNLTTISRQMKPFVKAFKGLHRFFSLCPLLFEALQMEFMVFMSLNWFHTSPTVCSSKSGHDISLSPVLEEIHRINTFANYWALDCLHAERFVATQVK